MLARKIGDGLFKDILLYDYYWRLLRNNHVRSINDIKMLGVNASEIPVVISHMLTGQKKLPLFLLKKGIASKLFMLLSYLTWKFK